MKQHRVHIELIPNRKEERRGKNRPKKKKEGLENTLDGVVKRKKRTST